MNKALAIVLPILVLLAGAGGFAALRASKPQARPVEVTEKIWNVTVQPAVAQRLSPSLTLYARVDSNRVSTLSAALSADVLAVQALEGARVEQGELLVELDDREARLTLAQRQASLDEIRPELVNEQHRYETNRRQLVHEQQLLSLIGRDVERANKLMSRDMGSAAHLDEAKQSQARQAMAVTQRKLAIAEHASIKAALQARLNFAEAQLQRAQLDLERTRITAPFSGRVSSVQVSVGNRVQPTAPLLRLIDTANLELRAQIPSRYLATVRYALQHGEAIHARTTVDGRTITALLKRLSAEVKQNSGGADAIFEIADGQAEQLELGRTVELHLSLTPVENVIPIPATALYGTDSVYVLREQRMHRLSIQRAGEYRDPQGRPWLLIKNPGLDKSDSIITTQMPNAVEGLKVRVQQ